MVLPNTSNMRERMVLPTGARKGLAGVAHRRMPRARPSVLRQCNAAHMTFVALRQHLDDDAVAVARMQHRVDHRQRAIEAHVDHAAAH